MSFYCQGRQDSVSRVEERHLSVVLYTLHLIHHLAGLGTERRSARQTPVLWKLNVNQSRTHGSIIQDPPSLNLLELQFHSTRDGLLIALTKSPTPQVLYGQVLQHTTRYPAGARDAIVESHSWMEDVEDTSAVSNGESGARHYIHVNRPFLSNSLFRATFSCPSP